ncbi:Uncharacterised protein [Vibrio cholerae]|nr:Uncharacterised protein [Vibrio cholerae]
MAAHVNRQWYRPVNRDVFIWLHVFIEYLHINGEAWAEWVSDLACGRTIAHCLYSAENGQVITCGDFGQHVIQFTFLGWLRVIRPECCHFIAEQLKFSNAFIKGHSPRSEHWEWGERYAVTALL